MKVHSLEVRPLLGVTVDVETTGAVYHGTLLSCTSSSLWLVDGDDDLMLPTDTVTGVDKR